MRTVFNKIQVLFVYFLRKKKFNKKIILIIDVPSPF